MGILLHHADLVLLHLPLGTGREQQEQQHRYEETGSHLFPAKVGIFDRSPKIIRIFVALIQGWNELSRRSGGEESPGRAGRPTAESAEGSDLLMP